ncbi:MAG: amidohydrolase family protein [Rectinemataceae bacterium]
MKATMIIDAHHHLWRYSPNEYPWIGEGDLALRRDFGLVELHAELDAAGVTRTIAVQARQSLDETRWLLDLAAESGRIVGVVGWAPLADPGIGDFLDSLGEPRLVSLRHVVQDEADPEFLLRPAFAQGLAALPSRCIAYDLLAKPAQLPMAIACVDAHPMLRFVVDHAAKPDFSGGASAFESWARDMRALAERPTVYCKFSGLALEAGPVWSVEMLRPVFDLLLESFGPSRLLFGSDWPVCLLATSYSRWLEAFRALIETLSETEKASVLGQSARRAYRLEDLL